MIYTRDRRQDWKKDTAKEVTKLCLSSQEAKKQSAKREADSIVKDETLSYVRHKVRGRKYFYF